MEINYSGLIAFAIFLVALVIFLRYETLHEETEDDVVEEMPQVSNAACPLDINDEDAVVASLIASIEAHNETNKNVQVISVRKVN